jgi:hypothetical protein
MKAPLSGLGEPLRQAGQELSYRCDPESSAPLIQTSAETPPHASEQPDGLRTDAVETSVPESPAKEPGGRKDRGRRHAVHGSVLSRSLIRTLERVGENVRALRKIENELRATLKPRGALGRLFFDRFWASVLRLILVARLEEGGLASGGSTAKNSASVPSLREGDLPILVLPGSADGCMDDLEKTIVFDSDVFRRLALIARYDRSAAREMYRTMSLLLIMRSEGEAGLENWVRATVGVKNEIGKDNKNG